MSGEKSLTVCVVYAREDETEKGELIDRLGTLNSDGKIGEPIDIKISGIGAESNQELSDAPAKLNRADMVLYLVSRESLSATKHNDSMAKNLDRNKTLIPVILRECSWQGMGGYALIDIQALPKDGRPVYLWKQDNGTWENEERKGAWDDVIDGITEAIDARENRDESEQWFHYANMLLIVGQYQQAIDAYEEVKKRESMSTIVAAYNNCVVARLQAEEYEGAIKDSDEAIRRDDSYVEAYNNRGVAYRQKGDYDRAIADFSTAIEKNPDYAEAYNNRGVAYRQKGDYDRAIADFSTAIEKNPDYAEAYNNRGVAYRQKGEYECAIKDVTAAIEKDSSLALAYYNRGAAYLSLGIQQDKEEDYDSAIKNFDDAITVSPGNAVIYFNRGIAYRYKNNKSYNDAIANFSKAIEIDHKYALAYYNRGILYGKKEKYDAANEDFEKAGKYDQGLKSINSLVRG